MAIAVATLPGIGCQSEVSSNTNSKDNLFSPLPQGNPGTPGSSQSSNLTVRLDQTSTIPIFCEELDFDTAPDGTKLQAGQELSQVYSEAGVQISVWNRNMTMPGRPITFDSSNPSGNDEDLGTPNQAHGGPGQGAGRDNTLPRGMLLIKAENTADLDGDGLVDIPDDDARGGVFVFNFNAPRCMTDIALIDIERNESPVRMVGFDSSGRQVFEHRVNGRGNNSYQHHNFPPSEGTCGITELQVHLPGSGALESLRVCDRNAGVDLSIRDDLLDARSLQLRVGIEAIHKTRGPIKLVDTWFKLNPDMLKLGGALGPMGLVTTSVPTGLYSGIQVNILDVAVELGDGNTKSYGQSTSYFVDQVFDMKACRDADVSLNLDLAPQFIGDARGLDFYGEPWNPAVAYQQVTCSP